MVIVSIAGDDGRVMVFYRAFLRRFLRIVGTCKIFLIESATQSAVLYGRVSQTRFPNANCTPRGKSIPTCTTHSRNFKNS